MSAISLYARATSGFEERVAHTVEVLRQAAKDHPDAIVQATSLGAEDMVITDLLARHGLPITIGTLETGMLHEQTVALIGRIEERYDLKVKVYQPKLESVIHFVAKNGELPMYESIDLRKACCGIRKMEPLSRMLDGQTAWVTGLRREQSNNRAAVEFIEIDDNGRTKVNALADWSWADVWHYISSNDVPYNPLHDEFYPSIGCAPCTRAIAVGEDFRSGRWWWEDEKAKECGLHASHEDPVVFPIQSPIGGADDNTSDRPAVSILHSGVRA
ncbi:phosphoadenylyl-sulfate reductase [soil metagenome]